MKKFCHLCGARYEEGKSQPWVCFSCGNESYTNSVPSTEIVFFNEKGQLLICKRGIIPNKGKYDVPGGFNNFRESSEDTLRREINEELGLSDADYSEPQFVTSWVGEEGYKFSVEVIFPLNSVFVAKLYTTELVAQDDVESVEFVDMDELDTVDFSFKDYPIIIRKAHKVLFG